MNNLKRYIAEKDKYGKWNIRTSLFNYELNKYKNYVTLKPGFYMGDEKVVNKDKIGKLYTTSNYIMWCVEGDEFDNEDYFKKLIVQRKLRMIKHLENQIAKIFKDIGIILDFEDYTKYLIEEGETDE